MTETVIRRCRRRPAENYVLLDPIGKKRMISTRSYKLDDRELATILAGLRKYQGQIDGTWAGDVEDIATDCGHFESLSAEEIDDLCERLNSEGKE